MPKFNVFGKFVLDVRREDDQWRPYLAGEGKRRPANIHIPDDLADGDLAVFLEDLFHESGTPDTEVRRIG